MINDRTTANAEEVTLHQCSVCRHLLDGWQRCDAFPAGILRDILRSQFDHSQPHDGDQGVRFQPIAGAENPFDLRAAVKAGLKRRR